MNIELRQLRYFATVAEELHFGRAARRLHMTQPPLSQTIMAREEMLGAPLFERRHRALALTPAGAVFHPEVTDTLRALASDAEPVAGRTPDPGLTITTTVSFASLWVIQKLPAFRSRQSFRFRSCSSRRPRPSLSCALRKSLVAWASAPRTRAFRYINSAPRRSVTRVAVAASPYENRT